MFKRIHVVPPHIEVSAPEVSACATGRVAEAESPPGAETQSGWAGSLWYPLVMLVYQRVLTIY